MTKCPHCGMDLDQDPVFKVTPCEGVPEGWYIIVGKRDPLTGKQKIVAARPDGTLATLELET